MPSDDEAAMEREMRAYAGPDYAEPEAVVAEEIDLFGFSDIDELIRALVAFRARHPGVGVVSEADRGGWGDTPSMTFTAHRMESPEEVAARVEEYRRSVRQKMAARRAEYERMKREFGDAE